MKRISVTVITAFFGFWGLIGTDAAAAEQENSIPELLKFAREYDPGGKTGERNTGAAIRPQEREAAVLRVQIARQKQSISRLKKELAELQVRVSSAAGNQETEAKLRAAEEDKRLARELQAKLREKDTRLVALEKQHAADTEALEQVRRTSGELSRDVQAVKKQNAALKQQLENAGKEEIAALRNRFSLLQNQFREQGTELRRLRRQLSGAGLAQKISRTGKTQKTDLSTPAAKQAYVAGMTLGQNILLLNQGDALLGMTVADPSVVLAGVRDMLTDNPAMDENSVEETNREREKLVQKAIRKTIEKEKQSAAAWLAEFRKQPGVKRTPSGLWYRIDYEGDEPVPEGDPVVDISVRESLTDGTVVNDMELTGAVLTMKKSEYPPVFREAINLLRQHGRITIAVPPDRAYGDKGMPPSIPPGATMIYIVQLETPAEGVVKQERAAVPDKK